jgi:hypothetical protein
VKLTYELLCAAGTVKHYSERNAPHVTIIGNMYDLFEDEYTAAGEELADEEDAKLKALMPEKEEEVYCVPQRMLLLAKATKQ